ncbi:hypothetical protein FF2_031739 [Malus domestica]
MKLSIAHHGKNEPNTDFKRDKVFTSRADNHGKKPAKEAFATNTTLIKTSSAPNVYPFPDSNMDAMVDDLLEKKVIELPECKRPEEMNRINDPKYCKYHRIVGHHVGKCFILKELIMKLAQQGRIELDLEDTAATHTTTVVFESFDLRTRKPILQVIKPKGEQGRKHRRCSNRKPKRNIRVAKPIYAGEPVEQKPRIPVSLHEYFPDDFFQHCTIAACHMVEVEMEEPSKGKVVATEGENTLTPKEGLPTHFSIEEALQLPKKIRRALATVLASPNDHEVQESKSEGLRLRPHECATCCAAEDTIHFTDEDLLLGSKPHNHSLFVSGYVKEHKVNCMLVDDGSAINIMPKSTMTTISIKVDELSLSHLLIQGFNQGGQRAMGMIRVEMAIGELKSSTIFHVIDARTSYGLLLGRPWIHANGVVPYTLHQCLKFYQEGAKVIYGDTKPFTEAESHFADAKFYMDEDMEWQAVPKKQEEEAMPSASKNNDELTKPATTRGSRTPSNGPNIPQAKPMHNNTWIM